MTETAHPFAEYIAAHSIDAQHLTFEQSTHSVADAAAAVNASPDEFVKNICLMDEKERFITVIVRGHDKVDKNAVGTYLGVGKPRTATPDEILQHTGYPVGGVPSFGYDALILIDDDVMSMDVVYSGGGDAMSLVRVAPTTIQSLTDGHVSTFRVVKKIS